MLNYSQPIGISPVIYLTKPVISEPEEVEVEPGYFLTDPFHPSVETFASELAARRYYKQNYPDLYNELKVVS